MIHFGFRVFDVNWLVGTLRRTFRAEVSTDSRFLHLRNTKRYLYIYIYILLHTHATSA